MKRILISLSIIGAVAAIATGVTIALFSDTETSTGNIFVAGTMDLKVDHMFASYDGNPCTENCVEDTNTNLIQNGSFEVPVVTNPNKWDVFPDGTSGLQWRVVWDPMTPTTWNTFTRPQAGLVEYQKFVVAGWNPQEGNQYAELHSDWASPPNNPNAPSAIDIYQDLTTVAGKQYKISFWYSPRPGINAIENGMEVYWNGISLGTISANGIGNSGTVWTQYIFTVTATGATTRLEFDARGNPDTSMGTFLDNVSVHPIDCDYRIIGGTCTLWDEKDLGAGDYYWHYGDVKPGDYGVNIISLRAYSNDAYACLITHNVVDQENVIVDPEAEAGDITDPQGELSSFIKIFAWEDSTQNNIYDLGENILVPVNSPLTTAMNPAIALTASNTKYIGLAWCAGTQSLNGNNIVCSGVGNQNTAQTDTMTASITTYAEQQRNNGGFVCPSIPPLVP